MCYGSDLQFTANPNDPLSYFPGVNGQKPYGLLHLNALYDLSSNLYLDAVVQKRRAAHENAALVEMINRSNIKDSAIVIADRNYESYNTLEQIRKKGWHYLIRLREAAGILSNLPLPDGDFDMPVQIFLTKKQTNAVKALKKRIPESTVSFPAASILSFCHREAQNFTRSLFGSFVFGFLMIQQKHLLQIWTRILSRWMN